RGGLFLHGGVVHQSATGDGGRLSSQVCLHNCTVERTLLLYGDVVRVICHVFVKSHGGTGEERGGNESGSGQCFHVFSLVIFTSVCLGNECIFRVIPSFDKPVDLQHIVVTWKQLNQGYL